MSRKTFAAHASYLAWSVFGNVPRRTRVWPVRGSRVVTVAMIRGAIAVVAAVVVGGCSGGEERKQVFTAADAVRIANVRPARPGWSWPKNPKKHMSSGGSTT